MPIGAGGGAGRWLIHPGRNPGGGGLPGCFALFGDGCLGSIWVSGKACLGLVLGCGKARLGLDFPTSNANALAAFAAGAVVDDVFVTAEAGTGAAVWVSGKACLGLVLGCGKARLGLDFPTSNANALAAFAAGAVVDDVFVTAEAGTGAAVDDEVLVPAEAGCAGFCAVEAEAMETGKATVDEVLVVAASASPSAGVVEGTWVATFVERLLAETADAEDFRTRRGGSNNGAVEAATMEAGFAGLGAVDAEAGCAGLGAVEAAASCAGLGAVAGGAFGGVLGAAQEEEAGCAGLGAVGAEAGCAGLGAVNAEAGRAGLGVAEEAAGCAGLGLVDKAGGGLCHSFNTEPRGARGTFGAISEAA